MATGSEFLMECEDEDLEPWQQINHDAREDVNADHSEAKPASSLQVFLNVHRLGTSLSEIGQIFPNEAMQLHLSKEGVLSDMNSSLVLEEPQAQIKEEQEEQLVRPEEGLALLAVKHENDGEIREPVTIPSSENLKTQADLEDCETPQQTIDQIHSSHCSESDTEDSGEWDDQLGINTPKSGQRLSLGKNLTHDLKSTKQKECHAKNKCFCCKDCGKCLTSKRNLKLHRRIHTGEKPFTCTVCGERYTLSHSLKRHMTTHTGEKPFTCTVCGKSCTQRSNLKMHMMTHTGERPHTCLHCGKGFVNTSNLKTHMQTHIRGKPFTVHSLISSVVQEEPRPPQIRKELLVKPKGGLQVLAVKNKYDGEFTETEAISIDSAETQDEDCGTPQQSGERPFTCKVCGKMFSKTNHLKTHMMTHTEGYHITCTVCGKGFSDTSLKRHMMIHTGKKPFTCTVCGKTFSRKDYKKTHMMTHTGENPFLCRLCGKGFLTTSNLKVHMRTHKE